MDQENGRLTPFWTGCERQRHGDFIAGRRVNDSLLPFSEEGKVKRYSTHGEQSRWSLGWVSALDVEGRTIWIVDAHRDGRRFVVRADEILTAFIELESAIRQVVEIAAKEETVDSQSALCQTLE